MQLGWKKTCVKHNIVADKSLLSFGNFINNFLSLDYLSLIILFWLTIKNFLPVVQNFSQRNAVEKRKSTTVSISKGSKWHKICPF